MIVRIAVRLRAAAILLVLFTPVSAVADDRAGLPETLVVAGETLQLNGYGEREILWAEIYRAALYLPRRSADVGFIRDAGTAKALQILTLASDIPDRMPSDWRTVFREELSRELFGKLRNAYRDLVQGDVLTFAYAQGAGTTVSVNGDAILTDPGHGLMADLLDQWVGEDPVSRNLRRLLLAGR